MNLVPWKLILVFVLVGCSSTRRRVDYELNRFDDLLVTNSAHFGVSERLSKEEGGGSTFQYAALVENSSKTKTYSLRLKDADFFANDSSEKIECASSSDEVLTLEPQKRAKLICKMVLKATEKNKYTNRDAVGELRIPYGKSMAESIRFPFKIRIEDFE